MKGIAFKILFPAILIGCGFLAKYILWDYPVSTGKRTGNLVKLSEKGKVLPTWEGTVDLGSGDKLTFDFSVRNEELAKEMFDFEGQAVSIYYQEHFLGWPRTTKYDVIRWRPKNEPSPQVEDSQIVEVAPTEVTASIDANAAEKLLSRTMFCSLLGAIYADQELYAKVKDTLKEKNLYLYRQIEKCNH